MKEFVKTIIHNWEESYIFRTLISTTMSTVIGLIFILFNGFLGIIYSSLWHGTICVYYILLTLLRGIIVFYQRKESFRHEIDGSKFRTQVSKYTHILMLILNISLIVPIRIMINGERGYNYGLIPAIAMAAYTLYRIIFSCINLNIVRKETNCLVRELRVINMIDTLVAILSLQNAMIIATGGIQGGIKIISMYSSIGIFSLIVFITIRSIIINKE